MIIFRSVDCTRAKAIVVHADLSVCIGRALIESLQHMGSLLLLKAHQLSSNGVFDVVPQANEIVMSDIKSRVLLKVDKIAANVQRLAMLR